MAEQPHILPDQLLAHAAGLIAENLLRIKIWVDKTYHMRVLGLIDDVNIGQLDVQILVDRVQCSTDCQVIFELYSHLQKTGHI